MTKGAKPDQCKKLDVSINIVASLQIYFVGATVVEFPSDQTFDHFDNIAAKLADFLAKVVKFKVALGGS